jgi:hypothetical protein
VCTALPRFRKDVLFDLRNKVQERDSADVEQFALEQLAVRILVATEVASEGLNLCSWGGLCRRWRRGGDRLHATARRCCS